MPLRGRHGVVRSRYHAVSSTARHGLTQALGGDARAWRSEEMKHYDIINNELVVSPVGAGAIVVASATDEEERRYIKETFPF